MIKTLAERLRDPEMYVDACDEAAAFIEVAEIIVDKVKRIDWDAIATVLEDLILDDNDEGIVAQIRDLNNVLNGVERVRKIAMTARNIILTDMNNGTFVYETSLDESGYFPAKDMDDAEKKIKEHYLNGSSLAS